MAEGEIQQIEITVEEIIYQNLETGFGVLQGSCEGRFITAVGAMATVEIGERLLLTGNFTEHPNFGAQFQVQVFERKLPTTVRAIEKFLSAGAIKGIGPVLAHRIVEKFGVRTLEEIENDPNCLREIEGISSSKLKKLCEEFEKLFGMRRLMIYLEGFGIKPTDSVKAWLLWGVMALDLIRSNPYRLCVPEIGISFMQADAMARQLEFSLDHYHRIHSGFVFILQHNAIQNGFTCVPQDALLQVAQTLLQVDRETLEKTLDQLLASGKLCAYYERKPFIFLPLYYTAETYIALRAAHMLKYSFEKPENLDAVIELEEERCGLTFERLQKRAIREAVCHHLFILTGGPGTGKTTILNAVISILEQQGKQVGLCAPTGRAAKRLAETSGHKAATIHRLLGVQRRPGKPSEFVHGQENKLKYDAVIIDEMSMVDSMLFYALLQAVKDDCKLILTGDKDQLPPVGAGNVFKDLLAGGDVPQITLKKIFRQSAQSLIVTNAHAVVKGEEVNLSAKDNDCFFLERTSYESAAATIAELYVKRLPKAYGYHALEDIQVICPSKKTLIGTVEMNKLLQKHINPAASNKEEFHYGNYTYRAGDKVMQIKNDYDIAWRKGAEEGQGIFNGDIGQIRNIYAKSRLFEIDFDGKVAMYSFDMAKEVDLAYAITIHKSQGNEFKAVIMPVLGNQSAFYNRNLLYTGMTRGKELLVLVGARKSIYEMIGRVQRSYRYTGIPYFMKEELKGEEC